MFALCLNHISAVSAANTRAAPPSPIAAMASGEATVAASAAADE
jgi:hypothetical protein